MSRRPTPDFAALASGEAGHRQANGAGRAARLGGARLAKRGTAPLALAAGALLVPGSAVAQEIGETSSITVSPQLYRGDVAGARSEPEFSSAPLLVGPVFIEPAISVVGGYDSNVFNRTAEQGAAVATVTPVLRVRTNAPRHEARFSAVGHLRRFSRFHSENSEEFQLRGEGRLDLIDRHTVSGSVGFARSIEPRSSAGSVLGAEEPVSFERASAALDANIVLGALRISPGAALTQVDYAPVDLIGGGSADQSYRNSRTVAGNLSVGYDLHGWLTAFTELNYSDVNSTSAPAALSRDSTNISLVAGVQGDITPVISGELGVGYRWRDYALPRFLDFGGATYRADVQWYVTPLVSLRLQARQEFRNSGDPVIPGILSNQVGGSAYYDPLRNLRLAASATYEDNKYRETDTRARRASVRVQAQYWLDRHLSVGAFASALDQNVSGAPLVRPFTSLSAGLGLTLKP